jgi:hypothetical protein
MPASSPASILNQKSPDLGIPHRFSLNESDSNKSLWNCGQFAREE